MILVTGGTGFIGSYLLRQLILSGKKVRALKRKTSKASWLDSPEGKVEWIEGDVLDVISLNEAMEGVEQVYHCASAVSFHPKEKAAMMKVNVEGTANVVNAALDRKIKKLVHISSIAALGRSKTRKEIDETAPWEESPMNSNYAISKHLGEMEVWRGMEEGLNAVIISPSVVLGAGDWKKGSLHFFSRVWNGMPYYSTHTSGFVDVRDVVNCMVALMESNISHERFIISAENLSYQEICNEIADNFGKKRPYLKASPFLSALAWRIESAREWLFGTTPFITREIARTANHSFLYDNSKIKKALNYQFIPMKQTIKETCEVFTRNIKGGKLTMLPFNRQ